MNIQSIKPYDYQETAIEKTYRALLKTMRALVVMATGLGKTIVSCFTVGKFMKRSSRVLFLCHDTGILSQAKKEYISFFGNKYTYADFFGKKKSWNADKHNFVFATFQSLNSHLFESDDENIFSPDHFDYIVVDESHHAKAETFDRALDYFKPKWKLGITATPDREDELDIRHIFGKEVVNYTLPEALGKGWLTKVVYKIMSDGIDQETIEALVQEVLVDNVRMTEKQLNERLFIKKRTEEQVKAVLHETGTGKKAIIFCANITHLEHVAQFIPNCACVHSEQSDSLNDKALEAFKKSEVQHILVVDKFNEGIDIPDTDVLIFLRATDSYRIWLQQLGRGLRKFPGKDVVTVLDFVGNVERVKDIEKLYYLIREVDGFLTKNSLGDELRLTEALHVDGSHFSFNFTTEIIDLMKVVEIVGLGFYDTWEEASTSAIGFGFKTYTEYRIGYKKDLRLPSDPLSVYKDFPGWYVFLGGEEKLFYQTWQEASTSAIGFGFKTYTEYKIGYKKDLRLPSDPSSVYKDFPGWKNFLKTNKYETWQEASVAAIELGIKKYAQYSSMYKKDPRLPSTPEHQYDDFPGWYVFLGGEEKLFYQTWQEASVAAIRLGIKTQKEYKSNYKKDPKLPSDPYTIYHDFPGWNVFLGKENKHLYKTWQEAAISVKNLSIKSLEEYKKRYKEDPMLPSTLHSKYKNFPGWDKFLGK